MCRKKPKTTLNVTQMTVILYFITSKRLAEIGLLAGAKLCMHLCSALTAVLPFPQIAFAMLILNAPIYALTDFFFSGFSTPRSFFVVVSMYLLVISIRQECHFFGRSKVGVCMLVQKTALCFFFFLISFFILFLNLYKHLSGIQQIRVIIIFQVEPLRPNMQESSSINSISNYFTRTS